MRILKHSFLSLLRKPTKAAMILTILFIVFSLVFTGIIIQNSISQSKEYVRMEMGAVVEYKADYMKAFKDNLDDDAFSQMALSETTADLIADDKRVDKVYVNASEYSESKVYKMVTSNTNDAMVMDGGGFFELKATKSNIAIGFDTKKMEISQGRNIEEADKTSDENPIVISEDFANKNALALGDEMVFSSYSQNKDISYKIVGLYKRLDTSLSGNDIFVSMKSIDTTQGEGISSVYFKLKDPLKVDSFIEDQSVHLTSKYTVLDAGSSEYDQLTKPLDLMEMISKILIVVVFIAGAAIVISLITIFVRDRKFEVGLLLSSGEAKYKIILQFVLEIAIVAILAFSCSMVLSQQSSKVVSEWIVENQLVEEETVNANDIFMMGQANINGNVEMSNIAEDFDVSLTFGVVKDLFMISMLIVLIASLIPLSIILSYNPRQALQD